MDVWKNRQGFEMNRAALMKTRADIMDALETVENAVDRHVANYAQRDVSAHLQEIRRAVIKSLTLAREDDADIADIAREMQHAARLASPDAYADRVEEAYGRANADEGRDAAFETIAPVHRLSSLINAASGLLRRTGDARHDAILDDLEGT